VIYLTFDRIATRVKRRFGGAHPMIGQGVDEDPSVP